MTRLPLALLLSAALSGCGGGAPSGIAGDRAVVSGAGADLLKLRAGPGLGYEVRLGLPDGTALLRRDCVTELGQTWCRVALAGAPNLTGYVAADYLVPR
ncbi:SH3 domain-containing protein [Histidinibacterium lentulum]|uniref:SH3 domain-containing protein n=1 Tax=Histidinibacterium lentulum TaxID=2480588 RepID=A0A3N2R790_9RHOB|nr:SH3 domain-containing protein [Histidinibacterium lentulum]ROU03350.1 SH3 domain-containing protein [Histidinibacterium lentulum]